eukprot:CAMPEP_0206247792 /NCGR_PEP_ID=MMETSP0047_2-20121206/20009_1 /ASSEMBLY_ACC=CAM_ASM_000192 /TAXON_ID=195065 /ORGANISM="Chroomonas mesostigmatica_cf, Strain CCMP1168" /LENGTH=250 /DNA_ID=CAMNT_0053673361 /DNA_START=129 /DNA_END=881 /DNA_ORIENTATION=+
MSLAVQSKGKPFLTQLCDTTNQLWGSDRVLRSLMFALITIADTKAINPEWRALASTFRAAISQTRYINRMYGTIDGAEGLLYDKSETSLEAVAKFAVYGLGGIGYHILEHIALILTIIKKCDAEKIPRVKEWLVKKGLWDQADNIDAVAQWLWMMECFGGIYVKYRAQMRNEVAMQKAKADGDKIKMEQLRRERLCNSLDIIKLLADIPLAAHFGTQINGHPGLFNGKTVGLVGLVGSMSQFLSRFKKNA